MSQESQAEATSNADPSASQQRLLVATNTSQGLSSDLSDAYCHDDEAIRKERAANERALKESRESVWFLKEIFFNGQTRKIITQNYNGPCSFIAICNILILRDDIQILPPERTSVSYEFLSQLVGEYLLLSCPGMDLSAALTMMPLTQRGMDLNPLFTSPMAFRPAGDAGALELFEQARIPLIHGWVVDPASPEYTAVSVVEDYDSAVNLIVEADHLTEGRFVVDEDGPPVASSSKANNGAQWSGGDKTKVENALSVRHFLETTRSQLTYHGLFNLASTIEPGSLAALFRNSHLSVLHRRPQSNPHSQLDPNTNSGPSSNRADVEMDQQQNDSTILTPANTKNVSPAEEDSALYNLVTDVVFHNEPSVVWERLEDVDGGGSSFVDSFFRHSSPAGGDFAGHTAESALAAAEGKFDPADQELARQLQEEEDARAQDVLSRRGQQRSRQPRAQQQQQQQRQPQPPSNLPYPHNQMQQQQVQDPRHLPNHQRLNPAEALFDERLLQQQRHGAHGKPKRKRSCTIQ